jgi:hypothetical protein
MNAWQSVVRGGPEPPAFMGAELDPYPFISAFGLLWRMSRLAHLLPAELTAIGLYNRRSLDILSVFGRPSTPRTRLLCALQLGSSRVSDYWCLDAWSPIRTQRAFETQDMPLKRCPSCSLHGYHCTLFQLPSVRRCPWHDEELCTRCPQCGAVCWSRFDEDANLGRCACGHDPFDTRAASTGMWSFPTDRAEAWLAQYLEWVNEQRSKCWLVVTGDRGDWSGGFSTLAKIPDSFHEYLTPDLAAVEVVEFSNEGEDPPSDEFWGWCLLGGDRLMTYVPLPSQIHEPLAAATQSVVSELPQGVRPSIALANCYGLNELSPLEQDVASRPHCFIAPHGVSSTGRTWLNLSAVDVEALRFCGRLIETCLLATRSDVSAYRCSYSASQSHALDLVSGRRHLAVALEKILLRGYREGLAVIIRRHMPVGNDAPPLVRSTPIAEVVATCEGIQSIRLVWVPRCGTPITPKCTFPASKPNVPDEGGERVGQVKRRKTERSTNRPSTPIASRGRLRKQGGSPADRRT